MKRENSAKRKNDKQLTAHKNKTNPPPLHEHNTRSYTAPGGHSDRPRPFSSLELEKTPTPNSKRVKKKGTSKLSRQKTVKKILFAQGKKAEAARTITGKEAKPPAKKKPQRKKNSTATKERNKVSACSPSWEGPRPKTRYSSRRGH